MSAYRGSERAAVNELAELRAFERKVGAGRRIPREPMLLVLAVLFAAVAALFATVVPELAIMFALYAGALVALRIRVAQMDQRRRLPATSSSKPAPMLGPQKADES